MKVLYILGSSRCGSTVLANILGELDGLFSAGEIRYLWERVLQRRRCGCSLPVGDCHVWGPVLGDDRADLGKVEAVAELQRVVLRMHRTPYLVRGTPQRLLLSESLARYVAAIGDVYARLGNITGARVIVDSSKRPSNGAILRLMPGVEPFFLHLVRDPRAVAYSNLRLKPNPDRDGGQIGGATSKFSGIHWLATNLTAEDVRRHYWAGRSMLLRYEDFVAAPKAAIDRIVKLVGERPSTDPFIGTRTVALGTHHTVSGNPARFATGKIELREDAAWKRELSSRDRLITTVVALPLLRRYRYPVRPDVHSLPSSV